MSQVSRSARAPRRPRLLLVDDDRLLLDGMLRLLSKLEPTWELRRASGADEALSCMDREIIDVVITDLDMPGMDGSRLIEELERSHPGAVRVVHSSQPETLVASSLAHLVLEKPATPPELLQTFRRAVELARERCLAAQA